MYILLKSTCLLLFLFIPCCIYPQESYHQLRRSESEESSLLSAIKQRYDKDVSTLKGNNKKYLQQVYKERFEEINKNFSDKLVVSDPQVNSYLSSITKEIVDENPFIHPAELRILFSYGWWPNASSMGEGTILFNIGLFHRLENEAQVAFVICHELSHYYLDHSNKSIERYVNSVNSDEFQKKIKAIQKTEYRQNQQAEVLLKGLTFNSRRHSREFEQQADSMAIQLMKHTPYDLRESLRTLALLDSVDKDKYNIPLELPKRFNFEYFPFKKSWIQSSTIRFGEMQKETSKDLDDSLKTHPDCRIRIQKIEPDVQKFYSPGSKKFIVSENTFEKLKKQFDYEIIQYCFDNDNISRCLYYALEMSAIFPGDVYFHTMIGKCLNSIYTHQQNHELGKIVDLPGSEVNNQYNTLLKMLQNLRLSEISSISYYYLLQHVSEFSGHPEFSHVFEQARSHFNN
jgi:Zn-dependent protease with chaperone function